MKLVGGLFEMYEQVFWCLVLRYKSQEVKGSLVFSYSRVWVLSCTLYIALWAQLNTLSPLFVKGPRRGL